MFLGLRGTSNFSLLPLRARAVTVAQGLVFSFFSHNFLLWVRPSWKSLAGFLFQDPFRLLILAIWSSSPFQLFGCPPSLSFFPNSWNLLLLGWKFPSNHFYLWLPHSWFLMVQLPCSWMFVLYFLIPHCMTGYLRPVCPSQLLWSYLDYVVCPRGPRALASSGISAQFSLLGFFWLTNFWPTGPFFCFMEFKAFSLHGFLDPNSLDFSSFSSFFSFLHYRITQCAIFLWALGYD